MRTLATLVFGMTLGAAALLLGVYFYFAMGQAPVATSAPAMPFEKMLAHKALAAMIDREMPRTVPLQPDEANLAAGAATLPPELRGVPRVARAKRNVDRKGHVSAPSEADGGKRRDRRRAREKVTGRWRMAFA